MAANTPLLTSASGMKMPIVGLGTLRMESDEALEKAIVSAIDAGYRHFDCAYNYENEEQIGKAFKKVFASGKVKREDIFITTKLPMIAMRDYFVEDYLKRSLKDLQMSYVDLYLIHKPVGFEPGEKIYDFDDNGLVKLDLNTDHVAIWKAMEKQVDAGRAKFIGLSDFTIPQIERILKIARIKPSCDQIECHLYFQRNELREWCTKQNIPLVAFCCLAAHASLPLFNKSGWMKGKQLQNPLEDPVVIRIAKAHNKAPGQVLLRHLTQLGTGVIPKSSNPERLKQNLNIFDFKLTDAEMNELNTLDAGEDGRKFNCAKGLFPGYDKHPECPYPKK